MRSLLFLGFLQCCGFGIVWASAGSSNIAVDSTGNLYVAAITATAHLQIQKIDVQGTASVWLDLGADSRLEALKLDPLDSVYIAYTASNGHIFVNKYNSSAVLGYSVDEGATNRLETIATDSSGDLYISWTSSIGHAFLEKHDHNATGNRIYYLDQGPASQFNAMAVDAGENLYASLTNSTGNLVVLWLNSTGGSPSATDLGTGSQLFAFAPDNANNSYVCYITATGHLMLGKYSKLGVTMASVDLGAGSRPGSFLKDSSNNIYLLWTSTTGNLFLNKYSSDLSQSASIDQGVGSQPAGLTSDALGNYFAAFIASTGHLLINKYDSTNTPATPVDFGANAQLYRMSTDSASSLYVAWTSPTAHLQANKYLSSGTLKYSLDLGRAGNWNGMAVGPSGTVFLEFTSTGAHLFAAQYDTAGGTVYSADLSTGLRPAGASSSVSGNLVDAAGNAYASTLAGSSQTITKYGPTGTVLHTRTLSTPYTKSLSALDVSGNSYTASLTSTAILEKRNAAGLVAYTVTLSNAADIQYLAIDPSGNAFIGWVSTSGTAYFERYDVGGAQIFSYTVGSGGTILAAVVDAAGFSYVGYSNSSGWAFVKLGPAGATAYNLAFGSGTQFVGLASDSSGNIFLGYYDNSGLLTVNKYDFHGDLLTGSSSSFAAGTRFYGLSTDTAGCLYVVYSDSSGLHLTKRDAGGNTIFSRSLGAITTLGGFSVDTVGNSYLGYLDTGSALHVQKYDVGGINGAFAYNLNLGSGSKPWVLSSDSAGDAYVVYTDNSGVLTLGKYNPAGASVFSVNLGAGSTIGAAGFDVVGNSYVGYTASSGAVTFASYHGGGGVVLNKSLGSGVRFALDETRLRVTVTPDSVSVGGGTSIGLTISATNAGVTGNLPANGAVLTATLPAGTGINWAVSPAYSGPGICSITSSVGNQVLQCNLGYLLPKTTINVHITSPTTSSSCANYTVSVLSSAVNSTLVQASGSENVQCASIGLSIAKMHSGNFLTGQNGTYTITVSNSLGSQATAGLVTVTDTVPTGLTLASMSGSGWNCPAAGNSCSRSDSLAGGSSYPSITAIVSIAGNAASQLTNHAAVTGGGSFSAGVDDPTAIQAGPSPLQFVPITPCRVVDTRNPTGPLGGPYLQGNVSRTFPVRSAPCGVPSNAAAYALNVTVVPRTGFLGYLLVWPTGQSQPVVSTLNSYDGSVLANFAMVGSGTNGAVDIMATNDAELVMDISGYYVPPATGSLQFYPLTPCRLFDTRNPNGPTGGPFLTNNSRSFPVTGNCGVPSNAVAYSLNFTVVPHGTLGYITAWPTGQGQPTTSVLNSLDGTVLANAAIIPGGTGGAISVYAAGTTDVLADVNGYFAPPSSGGLYFYPVNPCRAVDTRGQIGPLGGGALAANGTRAFPLPSSACNLPGNPAAYSLNVTAVPSGFLGYLTAWPSDQSMPLASTLNGYKGLPVANAALLPAAVNGSVSVYVTDSSNVLIDINGFFGH